jgi:hypothetical protein
LWDSSFETLSIFTIKDSYTETMNPDNILIGQGMVLAVVDFGLALNYYLNNER